MTQIAGRLYTVEEFLNMPEYDERYELIDGRLVEKPMAKIEHALIQRLILSHYEHFDFEEKTAGYYRKLPSGLILLMHQHLMFLFGLPAASQRAKPRLHLFLIWQSRSSRPTKICRRLRIKLKTIFRAG